NWHRLIRHEYEALSLDDAPAEPADPEEHAALCDLVQRALGCLEPEEHDVLVRHHLDGESCAELGAVAGLTKGGAHFRVTHAMERFARHFGRLKSNYVLGAAWANQTPASRLRR